MLSLFGDPLTPAGLAAVASVTVAVISFWLRPVVQRWFRKSYEYEYLLKELGDICRHLGANIKVIKYIIEDDVIPAPMHLNKLKIPESSAIFSIETLKLADFAFSSRLYELRLKLRNLNLEIDDLLAFSDLKYSKEDFLRLLSYHLEKTQKIELMMPNEIQILTHKHSFAAQESVVLRTIVPRPCPVRTGDKTESRGLPNSDNSSVPANEEGDPVEAKVTSGTDSTERMRPQD